MPRFRGSRAEAVARASLLIAAAAAPFGSMFAEAIRLGVPDYLLTGDGAVLELRTWQAAHGVQLLGPYSRFYWSHPGPLWFYLSAPIYEWFGERGPALNLFALSCNAVTAIAIVLTARRLRGDAFAWTVAAWLAVLELAALPFLPASIWNPVTPILPLALLSLLSARLALGAFGVLPWMIVLASAIVQTHVGFGPVVAAAAAVPIVALLRREPATGRRLWTEVVDRRGVLIAAGAVFVVCWMLPIYEGVSAHPSNLTKLWHFFKARNPDVHPWTVVFTTIRDQLAGMPIAVMRPFTPVMPAPGAAASTVMALGLVALPIAAIAFARWRRDAVLGMLGAIAVVEIAASGLAIRSIRGGIEPYLLYWMVIPGFMSLAVLGAWLARARGWWSALVAMGGAGLTLAVILAPIDRWRVYGDQEVAAEQLARDVDQYVAAHHVVQPVVRLAAGEIWPTAAAVILHLRKQGTPVLVEPAWSFMFGKALEDPGGDHPRLIVGSRAFAARAEAARLVRVADAGDIAVYFEPAGVVNARRLPPPAITASEGVTRDPHLAADGVIPVDGSNWDARDTVGLRSTSSSVTVAVPRGDVRGLFVSVDGNDLYTVRCAGQDRWQIGVTRPEEGLVGMQTLQLFADDIGACADVTIAPASGDGSYSIGEIGFLGP